MTGSSLPFNKPLSVCVVRAAVLTYASTTNTHHRTNSSGWTTTQKLELVNKFMGASKGLSDFTKQLLPYFVEQKMIKHLPEIKDQFLKLMKEKRGEIDVFVTSAVRTAFVCRLRFGLDHPPPKGI